MGRNNFHQQSRARRRLTGGLIAATGLSLAVIVSAWRDHSNLGAPHLWPWLLTGLQVMALWSASRGRWWGGFSGDPSSFPGSPMP